MAIHTDPKTQILAKKLDDKRIYKIKNAAMKFFCPLCRLERAIQIRPRLTLKHYVQVGIISITLMTFTAPRMGAYSLIFFFLTWACFEAGVRMHFRKEVPCPYCGFDASWYKRDVKIARQKVKDFWKAQGYSDQQAQAVADQANKVDATEVQNLSVE